MPVTATFLLRLFGLLLNILYSLSTARIIINMCELSCNVDTVDCSISWLYLESQYPFITLHEVSRNCTIKDVKDP